MSNFFLEEETVTICNLFLIAFAGPYFKYLMLFTLSIWASLNVAQAGQNILQKNPNAPGLAALAPIFESIKINRIAFVQLKSHIEVFLGMAGTFLWPFGFCAPLFPIVFLQFLRVRYVTSNYTRLSFKQLDEQVLVPLLPDFAYDLIIGSLKPRLRGYVKVNSKGEPLKEDGTVDKQTIDQIKDNQSKRFHNDVRKEGDVRLGEPIMENEEEENDSADEPKTYEILSDSEGEGQPTQRVGARNLHVSDDDLD